MKNFFKAFYRKKWLFWPLIAIVAIVGYKAASGGSKVTEEFIAVTKGTVVETVTATGTVRPKNAASLRFESAGTISTLNFEVGDEVKKGQLMATLNAGDLRQKVTQAEAELASAQVALQNAAQGMSDTDIRSGQSLSGAYSDALAGLGEILNLVQEVNNTVTSIHRSGVISPTANTTEKLEDAYDAIILELRDYTPATDRATIEAGLEFVYEPLLSIQEVVLKLVRSLNSLSISDANDAYKQDAATALSDINDAVARVVAYRKAITDAKTEGVLDGNTSSAAYKTAQAQVETARAAVAIARANLANAYLYAPITGVVAVKSKSIGEGVSPTDQIYYMIGEGGLEVTANIPEIEIAKIQVGNTAAIVLDAYGEENPFTVVVTAIDPAETIVDGVATYKTTFAFDQADPRVRSGMTANITVSTQTKENVVIIPYRAVFLKDGKRFVRTLSGETRTDVAVKLGLRGNDGTVEVQSGLAEGDVVVIEMR